MNKVILMGRLTRDPEMRYTSTNNTAICSFSLAVNRKFGKPGEEKQADFIPILVWDKQAEFCGKYFKKGQQVVVVGRLQVSTWDDNEGKKRYKTEVVAEETYFAEGKREEGAPSRMPSTGGNKESADGFFPLEEEDELPF